MPESDNVFEKYKLDKNYKFLTSITLSGLLLTLIFLLVYVASSLAVQQVLVALIGMVGLTTLEAFKRSLEDRDSYQKFTIYDNRKLEKNTIYNTTSYAYERQNLAEAAAEIQQLLDQLAITHPMETKKDEIEIAVEVADKVEQNPTLKTRVIEAVKAGGKKALIDSIRSPMSDVVLSVLMATVTGWIEAESDVKDKEIDK